MTVLAGPYAVAAVLLVVGGLPKLRRPDPLRRAARSVGMPAPAWAVRVLAAAEVLLGGAALLVPAGPFATGVASAVAASYAGFTAFVLLARARGGVLSSCGCFGRADTPPTAVHAAVTAGYAAVALAVAALPLPSAALATLAATPLAGLPALAVSALAVWFTYLVLAAIPRLHAPPAVARPSHA